MSASRRWSRAGTPNSAATKSSSRSGAIHSPAHLLRAGIGPAGHLRDLGIEVVAHVPGVGQRLMDHPVGFGLVLHQARLPPQRADARHILLALRYSSGIGGAPAGDMFVVGVSKSSWHAVGEQIGSLLAASTRPSRKPARSGLPRRLAGRADRRVQPACPTGATSSG